MNDPLFLPASFFILRTPLFPYAIWQSYQHSPDWADELFQKFENDSVFREAILVASPALYEAMQRTCIKDREKIAIALLQYATRMATRGTPFGLFSAVTPGKWSDETHIDLTQGHFKKRMRPDMCWVWALIQDCYKKNFLTSSLPVSSNPLARLSGDRIYVDYIFYTEKKEKSNKSISIRASKVILSVLVAAKEPITYQAICESIHQLYPNISADKLQALTLDLLNNQFLIPSVIPSLLDLSLNLPFEGMNAILDQMTVYENHPIGQGEQAILHLQKSMEAMVKASSYLQVDLAYKNLPIFLSKKVAHEAGNALEFMWHLSFHMKKCGNIVNYHSLFMDKYGTARTVPVLELLDEEKGLGFLENNPLLQTQIQESLFSSVWRKWLHGKIQESLFLGKNEIVIPPDIIDDLKKISEERSLDLRKVPPSCEVFFKIVSQSQADLDAGNFNLVISQFGWEGGASIGRFLDLLKDPVEGELSAFFKKEEDAEPNARFVEVSYWPKEARYANIAIHPCLRKYRLEAQKIANSCSMSLDDIYVGATHDHLYLTDKSGEIDILTCVGNRLTIQHAPEAIRFLREVTYSRFEMIFNDVWGEELKDWSYLPRICYGKTIFSPATWNLDGALLLAVSKEDAIKKFTDWAQRWQMPTHVVLTQEDNQLLFDRTSPIFLKKVAALLLKKEKIRFIENLSTPFVMKEQQAYASEFVVPFVKNTQHSNRQKIFSPRTFYPISFEDRWQFPGGDWLYVSIYLGKSKVENFLIHHLFGALKKMALPWFYVRYQDPLNHLRVRIEVKERDLWNKVLLEFEKILQFWMERGFVKKFEICSYEREVERYGGSDLIETVEKLFCADTLSTLSLLYNISMQRISVPLIARQTISIICFLKGFEFNDSQIICLLEKNIKNRKNLAGYREHKTFLLSYFQETTPPSPVHVLFQESYNLSRQAKHAFLEKSAHLNRIHMFEIVDSLLHMHCNRLNGDNQDEATSRCFAYQTLIELEKKGRDYIEFKN